MPWPFPIIAVIAVLGGIAGTLAAEAPESKDSPAALAEALQRADQLIALEKLEEALSMLKAIEIKTPKAAAQVDTRLGKIYLRLDKPAKALELFEHAALSAIEDAEASLGAAQATLALGRLAAARRHAGAALRGDAGLVEAHLVLARADDRGGNIDAARDRLAKLLRDRPDSEAAAVAYASFLFQRGQEAAAIDTLSRFVARRPQAAEANDLLGQFHWQLGGTAKGLQFRTNAAKAYIAQGNDFRAEAIIAWIQAHDRGGRYLAQLRSPRAAPPPARPPSGDARPPARGPAPAVPPTQVLTRPEPLPIPPGATYSQGSGFIVGDGRYVVTNRHVIEKGKTIAVRNGVGEVRQARVLKIAANDDLAVLELETPFAEDFAVPIEAMVDPQPGRSAVILGFPLASVLGEQMPSLTDGVVSKASGLRDDPTTFQITAKMNKGNSGGPVFDRWGNLIGVAVAKLDVVKLYEKSGYIPEDVNIAIKISRVFPMMNWPADAAGSAPPAGSEMSAEDLYQLMLPKVVMIAAVQ